MIKYYGKERAVEKAYKNELLEYLRRNEDNLNIVGLLLLKNLLIEKIDECNSHIADSKKRLVDLKQEARNDIEENIIEFFKQENIEDISEKEINMLTDAIYNIMKMKNLIFKIIILQLQSNQLTPYISLRPKTNLFNFKKE